MKKYKLKKWYPSLPKDWEEGMEVGQGDRGICSWYSPCNAKYSYGGNSRLATNEVEKNPEYWEKVIEDPIVYHIGDSLNNPNPSGEGRYYIYADKESHCKSNGYEYFYCKKDCEKWVEKKLVNKDYEILSLYTPCHIFDRIQRDGNYYKRRGSSGLEGVYPNMEVGDKYLNQELKIHSIKRFSDGQIFSVDDIVSDGNIKHTIKSFQPSRLVDGGLYINVSDGSMALKHCIKPKFLFKTKDGIDIYEGDYACYVQKDNDFYISNMSQGLNGKLDNAVYFSSIEAAEEYVLMNKPIKLSLQEIQDKIPSFKAYNFFKLIDLIKNNIK